MEDSTSPVASADAPLRSMVDDSVEESVDSNLVLLLSTANMENQPVLEAGSTVVTPSSAADSGSEEEEESPTKEEPTEETKEPAEEKKEQDVNSPAVPSTPPPKAKVEVVSSPSLNSFKSSPSNSSVGPSPNNSSHRRSPYKPYAYSPSTPKVETKVIFLGDVTESQDPALLGIAPRQLKDGAPVPVDLSMTSTPEKGNADDSVLTDASSPAWKGTWTDATTAAAAGAALAAASPTTTPQDVPAVASLSPLSTDTLEGAPQVETLDKGVEDTAPPPAVAVSNVKDVDSNNASPVAVENGGDDIVDDKDVAVVGPSDTDPETPDKDQDETAYFDAGQDNLDSQKAVVAEAEEQRRRRRRCYTRLAALLLFVLLIILLPVLLVKKGNDSLDDSASATMTSSTSRGGNGTITSTGSGTHGDDDMMSNSTMTTNSTTGTGRTFTTAPAAAPVAVPSPTRTAVPTPEFHFEGPGAFLHNDTLSGHGQRPSETNVTTTNSTMTVDMPTSNRTDPAANVTGAFVEDGPEGSPGPGGGPGGGGPRAGRGAVTP